MLKYLVKMVANVYNLKLVTGIFICRSKLNSFCTIAQLQDKIQ